MVIILVLGALVAVGAFLAYMSHIGAMKRVIAVYNRSAQGLGSLLAFAREQYFDLIVPGLQKAAQYTIAILAIGVVGAWWTACDLSENPSQTGSPMGYAALATVVAVIAAIGLWLVSRLPEGEDNDAVVLAGTDRVNVTFARVGNGAPLVRIEPIDSETEFRFENVTPTSLVIRLPAVTTDPVHFHWTVRPRSGMVVPFRILLGIVLAMLAMAVTLFCAAHALHSRAFVVLSLGFTVGALSAFLGVYGLVIWAGALTVGALEYLPNALGKILVAAVKNDAAALEAALTPQSSDKQAFNFVNQEEFKRNFERRKLRLIATLVPVFSWAMLFPYWPVFSFWRLAEFVGAGIVLLYGITAQLFDLDGKAGNENRKKRAEGLWERQAEMIERSLAIYAALSLAAFAMVGLVILFGDRMQMALDRRAALFSDWLVGVVSGDVGFQSGIPCYDWRLCAVAILLLVLALFYVVPRSKDALYFGVRTAASAVLALAIVFFAVCVGKSYKDGTLACSSPAHGPLVSIEIEHPAPSPKVVIKTPAATDVVPLPPPPVETGTPCGKCQNNLKTHLDALKQF